MHGLGRGLGMASGAPKLDLIVGSSYHLRMGGYSRLIKLQSQHLRLCINSLALRNAFQEVLKDPTSVMYGLLTSAAMSALDIAQAYIDSATTDGYFTFALDVSFFSSLHAQLTPSTSA
jgi:hypothetical protein